MATEVELAWVAGIIDGEGCIYITRNLPGKNSQCLTVRHHVAVKVTMGHEPTIDRVLAIAGVGTKQNHVSRGPRINASWSWIVASRKAESFLHEVRPYLYTKAAEADVALEFLALPLAKQGGRGGNMITDPATLQERERLWAKIRDLKPRSRFSVSRSINAVDFLVRGRQPAPVVRSICSECDQFAKGHGYCDKHYQRWKKHGDPHIVGTAHGYTKKGVA